MNLTEKLSELIKIITEQTDLFKHIDPTRILVCISSNRTGRSGGKNCTYGKLVPLKFPNGGSVQKYRGNYYTIPRVINKGVDQLYIIYFYMPRFFNMPVIEKLRIIFHELYHINEEFNGDIRRMGNQKALHGSSKDRFNSMFDRDLMIFHDYIKGTEYMDFLKMDSERLKRDFKRVYGRRLKIPKPVILRDN